MKRIAWGIVVGGATAAFVGSAAANATGDTWTPNYDVDHAQLLAGPGLNSAALELPASVTSSDGTILTGTDYVSLTPGGFDDEFVTGSGAIFDQNQLFPGFTNLYYAPVGGDAVDVMKTPFGTVDLSSMASTFAPADIERTFAPAATVGQNFVVADGATYRIGEALGLYDNTVVSAAGELTSDATITTMQAPDTSLVWAAPAAYTVGTGADATTLTGTLYVTSPTDVEFVDKAGDVFDQNLLVSGPFFVENLYYDPVNGPAVDQALTPLGLVDLSPIAPWFAPTDVSDLVAATPPVSDLSDAGLYSVLDLASGLTS